MSSRDRTLLRDLARQVAEIAALPEQAEKTRLWTACNDLRPERLTRRTQMAARLARELA